MSYGDFVNTVIMCIDSGIFVLLLIWAWLDRNNIYFRKGD